MDNLGDKNINKNNSTTKVNSPASKDNNEVEVIETLEIESVSGAAQDKYKEDLNNENKQKLNGDSNNKSESLTNDKKEKPEDKNNKELKKGDELKDNKQNQKTNNPNSDDNKNTAKDAAKDAAVDAAAKAAEPAIEAGKQAAAKAAGVAITAASGGIIPPKVGEIVSKKVMDVGEEKLKDNIKNSKNKNNQGPQKKKTVSVPPALKEAGDKLKSSAKNSVKKGAKAISTGLKIRKFVKMLPAILSVLAIACLVFGLATLVSVIQIYLPGSVGDVKKDVESENYTNRDKKILSKIETITRKYPRGDGAVVLAAVAYPYYDLVQNDNVKEQLKPNGDVVDSNSEDEETIYDQMDLLFEDDENLTWSQRWEKYKLEYQTATGAAKELVGSALKDAKEWVYNKFGWDYDDEEEENYKPQNNDMYLNLFAKKSYRDKYEELLKVYSDQGKDAYEEYLKTTYIANDDGYQKLLKEVPEENVEEVSSEIVTDITSSEELYEKYIPEVKICSASLKSAGTVEVDDVIKSGNIFVDVKEETCNNDVDNCTSQSGMPISLQDYVYGVVNTEISVDETTSMDKIKAQMIMVKSVVLGRYKEMGWTLEQTADGAYVLPIRANTNDQDYCDYKVGCSGKSSGNEHGKASDAVIELYNQAWSETINQYIYDSSSSRTVAYYRKSEGYDSNCPEGKCLLTKDFDVYVANGDTYEQIIAQAYSKLQLISIEPEGGYATVQVSGNEECTTVTSGNGGIPDEQFIYFDQKNYKDTFCGRSDATISSSGCGVTSMAMVLANLTYESDIDPVYTMNEAHDGGYCGYGIFGTSAQYFWLASEKHGLTIESLSRDADGIKKVEETLKNGGLVIVNVKENSPFTNGGHYIVIRKIDENGYVYVADPNHQELFNTPYTLNQFVDNNWFGSGGWQAFIGPKSPEYASKITSTGDPGVATGYLGNVFNPEDTIADYSNSGNAKTFPKYSSGSCHGGVDLATDVGTAVYAMDGGTVSETNTYDKNCVNNSECGTGSGNNSFGNLIVIDHGNGYLTRYAHLSKKSVAQGDVVAKGQLIGYSGNTGYSTGPHLHIELEKTDLLNEFGRSEAKCSVGKGLLNPTKYINSSDTYVGKTQ